MFICITQRITSLISLLLSEKQNRFIFFFLFYLLLILEQMCKFKKYSKLNASNLLINFCKNVVKDRNELKTH